MLTVQQQTETTARVEHFIEMGNTIFNINMRMPNIIYKKRGTCGATAWYSRLELNFNAGLMVDNWDEYMNQVVPHEVAHLIKEHIYGRGKGSLSAHGAQWKHVMVKLGVSPDRTHTMDTSKVARKMAKFQYKCNKCGTEIPVGAQVHKKISLFGSIYGHKKCKGSKLVPLSSAVQQEGRKLSGKEYAYAAGKSDKEKGEEKQNATDNYGPYSTAYENGYREATVLNENADLDALISRTRFLLNK